MVYREDEMIRKKTAVSFCFSLPLLCVACVEFVCRILNFGGPFQAVKDERRIELNRWHRGTPQSIILSHGFTFHHLVNPHTHINTHMHMERT